MISSSVSEFILSTTLISGLQSLPILAVIILKFHKNNITLFQNWFSPVVKPVFAPLKSVDVTQLQWIIADTVLSALFFLYGHLVIPGWECLILSSWYHSLCFFCQPIRSQYQCCVSSFSTFLGHCSWRALFFPFTSPHCHGVLLKLYCSLAFDKAFQN